MTERLTDLYRKLGRVMALRFVEQLLRHAGDDPEVLLTLLAASAEVLAEAAKLGGEKLRQANHS